MRYFDRGTGSEAAIRDLGHRQVRVRVAAAEALARCPEDEAERARAALLPYLEDSSPDVRYMVALSLGRLGSQEAVEPLMELYRSDPELMPRQAAVAALGELGDTRATEVLLEALSDELPDLRFQATSALTQVNPAAAAAPLRRALGDEDPEVRASAAAGLGDLGDAQAADELHQLADDDSVAVRIEAAVALSKLDDGRGRQALARYLDDRDYGLLAAEQLFRRPDPGAMDALHQILDRWLAPRLQKVWAAAALVKLGDDRGREVLLQALESRKETVRGLTLQLLGQLGAPWCQRTLEELANSAAAGNWSEWQDEIAAALEQACGAAQKPLDS
jgi:HEAT repeat protein